ncbi:MAG TPA: preprotein translocase subunit SecG [Candidatus Woesebacteria bacterium]|jgi:preprotein translocase subunit SecG|nr:preprotein translocase subunit SecG [Candidatus Woesebacteria bacterium]
MLNFINIGQILLAILIVTLILLQAQGTGLGATWGGGGETYHTKRGVEKLIFYLTILCVLLFVVFSLAALMN